MTQFLSMNRHGSGAAVSAAIAGVSPAMESGARRPGGRRDAYPTTELQVHGPNARAKAKGDFP